MPQPANGSKEQLRSSLRKEREGERRVWRPLEGLTEQLGLFVLKVDPHNGGSSHLIVFGTEGPAAWRKNRRSQTPRIRRDSLLSEWKSAGEFGDNTVREVHGGATVFIPANTWISVTNIGTDAISAIFIFSAPGFEEFMRALSPLVKEIN